MLTCYLGLLALVVVVSALHRIAEHPLRHGCIDARQHVRVTHMQANVPAAAAPERSLPAAGQEGQESDHRCSNPPTGEPEAGGSESTSGGDQGFAGSAAVSVGVTCVSDMWPEPGTIDDEAGDTDEDPASSKVMARLHMMMHAQYRCFPVLSSGM